ESKYRIQKYEEALKSSYITYISIKITTIFSQINIIDFEYSKDAYKEIKKQIEKFERIHQDNSEASMIQTYIETALDVPFEKIA
ncbi:hypothetical protein VWM68_11495, partial [Campylobacter coli]